MKKITIYFCDECTNYATHDNLSPVCILTGNRLPNTSPVINKDDPTGTVYYGILIPKECPLEDDN